MKMVKTICHVFPFWLMKAISTVEEVLKHKQRDVHHKVVIEVYIIYEKRLPLHTLFKITSRHVLRHNNII